MKCDGVLIWSDEPIISKAFGVMVYPYSCPKCGDKGRATSKYKIICGYEAAQPALANGRKAGMAKSKLSSRALRH